MRRPSSAVPRPSSGRSSVDRLSFPSNSSDSLDQSYRDTGRALHYPRGRGGFSTPQLSRGQGNYGPPQGSRGQDKRYSFSGGMSEERYSVGGSYHGGVVDPIKGFTPRPEPDGQSDISSTSPDLLRQRQYHYDQRSPHRSILATPPCTPVPTDEREVVSHARHTCNAAVGAGCPGGDTR